MVQALILPISAIFFGYDLRETVVPIAAVVVVNTIGFSALGTLFAAVTARTRRSELLLPLLLFPTATPLIIWGVKATRLCLEGKDLSSYGYLIVLSVCFDAIFIVAGAICSTNSPIVRFSRRVFVSAPEQRETSSDGRCPLRCR